MFFVVKIFCKILDHVLNSTYYKGLQRKREEEWLSAEKNKFRKFGQNSILPKEHILLNPKYISIGDGFFALKNLRIEAWDEYEGEKFTPMLSIGNNVIMNTDIHIGCINKIIIEDNVLMASRIFITDHSHGEINKDVLVTPVARRSLISKGTVHIGKNVWIGEGVVIMPNVEIGENTIIGANSVVTKSFGANLVLAGVPAKCIKDFNSPNQ